MKCGCTTAGGTGTHGSTCFSPGFSAGGSSAWVAKPSEPQKMTAATTDGIPRRMRAFLKGEPLTRLLHLTPLVQSLPTEKADRDESAGRAARRIANPGRREKKQGPRFLAGPAEKSKGSKLTGYASPA